MRLNPEQQRAAEMLWQQNLAGLQIVAGAGSGKTTTLTAAIKAAIDAGIPAEKLAAITFSRRAAHELSDRLRAVAIQPGYCGTIHALAWRLIRERDHGLRIVKHAEQARITLLREMFPHYAHIPGSILLRKDFLQAAESEKFAQHWNEYLKRNRLIDFDAMISRAAHEQLGQGRFEAVCVDEFQDTSPDQFAFIRSLAAKKYLVVGDDWQSIYRFRGADVSLMQNFTRLVPGSERVYLVKNYRSARAIVNLGNGFIRRSGNFVRKTLKATKTALYKPVILHTSSENATQVWQKLLDTITSGKLPGAVARILQEQTAVLVRTNAQRLMLEKNKPAQFEILTIHKSKGLEFDNVLVFGIAEHSMPHRENDFDEEVRLAYVALTRARNFLAFVSWETGERHSAFLPYLMRQCRPIFF